MSPRRSPKSAAKGFKEATHEQRELFEAAASELQGAAVGSSCVLASNLTAAGTAQAGEPASKRRRLCSAAARSRQAGSIDRHQHQHQATHEPASLPASSKRTTGRARKTPTVVVSDTEDDMVSDGSDFEADVTSSDSDAASLADPESDLEDLDCKAGAALHAKEQQAGKQPAVPPCSGKAAIARPKAGPAKQKKTSSAQASSGTSKKKKNMAQASKGAPAEPEAPARPQTFHQPHNSSPALTIEPAKSSKQAPHTNCSPAAKGAEAANSSLPLQGIQTQTKDSSVLTLQPVAASAKPGSAAAGATPSGIRIPVGPTYRVPGLRRGKIGKPLHTPRSHGT